MLIHHNIFTTVSTYFCGQNLSYLGDPDYSLRGDDIVLLVLRGDDIFLRGDDWYYLAVDFSSEDSSALYHLATFGSFIEFLYSCSLMSNLN